MPPSVTLTMSDQTAQQFCVALLWARLLLIQYAPTMEPDDRLQAEAAYGGLQHLLDVMERGVEEALDSLPTDCWGRPYLRPQPALSPASFFGEGTVEEALEHRRLQSELSGRMIPPSVPSSDPQSGDSLP